VRRQTQSPVHPAALDAYRCPYSGEALTLKQAPGQGSEHARHLLVSPSGLEYEVLDGMPHLLKSELESFSPTEEREKQYYEETARDYDAVIEWLFRSFGENEDDVRRRMVDLLELQQHHRVLETGAGTCRDSVAIASRLGDEGEFYVQDLSPSMLSIGRERMREAGFLDGSRSPVRFFVGNAGNLPFDDGFFDAVYHFGGLNLFTDKRRALAEMARVVRVDGKVVVGDEGMAPWQRESEYGQILMTSNKLYAHTPPLDDLPEGARDVCVRWMIGSAFYVIDFRVGEGAPRVDLDLPILGKRGGTHRTRYFGVLEGVSPEAKRMAYEAAEASGLSWHDWVDRAVRAAASADLGDRERRVLSPRSRTARET